jgi:hypothetical protein
VNRDARTSGTHRHRNLEVARDAGPPGRDPGEGAAELAHLPRVLQDAPDLIHQDLPLGIRQLALDHALVGQRRRSVDPRVPPHRLEGHRFTRSAFQLLRGGAHHVWRDPHFTGQRFDAADRHRVSRGGRSRLQLRGALDDLFHFSTAVAPSWRRGAIQLVDQHRRRRRALIVPDREPAHQRALEPRPQIGESRAVRRGGPEEPAGAHRLFGRPAAGNLAHEHLVDDDCQTVHVGARVEIGETRGLLRTHVPGRAEGKAGAREVRATGGADRLGDPEIGDDRVPL